MNFTEEIEKMVELSSKQPNGVYQNTDRIFTGIMESLISQSKECLIIF